MGKDTRLQFRISESKKERFGKCAKKVRMTETALGEAAIDALCDYIELHGEITMPLAVVPESSLRPKSPFPSTVVPSAPRGVPSLNEPPASTPVSPSDASNAKEPKLTPTRAALRSEALKHKAS